MRMLLQTKLISGKQLINFNQNSIAYLDLNDPEPRNVFLKSSFDPDFFSIAKPFIPLNGVFFDLGANHGLCTFGLLPCLSLVNFHLFEANESLVQTIKKTIKLHDNASILVNHACISNRDGTTNFYHELNQSGQSHVATKEENGIEIENLVLDKYCDSSNIDLVDFAKIDLEGHELTALRGWESYLKKHQVRAIYIEIIPGNQKRYGLNANEPLMFLESLGYELYLCKKEDFANFSDKPKNHEFKSGNLVLSKFKAHDYPQDFSTDVLALTPRIKDFGS